MKVERIYLQPEVDRLKNEVQQLKNINYELREELAEISYHLKAIKEFLDGESN